MQNSAAVFGNTVIYLIQLIVLHSNIVPCHLRTVSLAGLGARCSSVVRAIAHGAMGRRIDPSRGEPIELFRVPASAPRLV